MSCYEDFEEIFSWLVESVVIMMNTAATFTNETLARHLLACVKRITKILLNMSNKDSEVSIRFCVYVLFKIC